jgi:pilus assembly protein Flp/PilA
MKTKKDGGTEMESLERFFNDESGLETVEYAIIAGLIVVGTIVTIISIGNWVSAKFAALDTALSGN